MKKLIGLSIFLLITIQFSVAQSAKIDFSQKPPNLDSLLPKIKAEKTLFDLSPIFKEYVKTLANKN